MYFPGVGHARDPAKDRDIANPLLITQHAQYLVHETFVRPMMFRFAKIDAGYCDLLAHDSATLEFAGDEDSCDDGQQAEDGGERNIEAAFPEFAALGKQDRFQCESRES